MVCSLWELVYLGVPCLEVWARCQSDGFQVSFPYFSEFCSSYWFICFVKKDVSDCIKGYGFTMNSLENLGYFTWAECIKHPQLVIGSPMFLHTRFNVWMTLSSYRLLLWTDWYCPISPFDTTFLLSVLSFFLSIALIWLTKHPILAWITFSHEIVYL